MEGNRFSLFIGRPLQMSLQRYHFKSGHSLLQQDKKKLTHPDFVTDTSGTAKGGAVGAPTT